VALLNEYRSADPRISVKTVDYVRDAGEAQKVKEQYNLNSPTDKNLIMLRSATSILKLSTVTHLPRSNSSNAHPKEREFRRKPVAHGEQVLPRCCSPSPRQSRSRRIFAGHGEPSLSDSDNFVT